MLFGIASDETEHIEKRLRRVPYDLFYLKNRAISFYPGVEPEQIMQQHGVGESLCRHRGEHALQQSTVTCRVLVICEGNICRSPMAAALLASRMPAVITSSAGTHALVGRHADPVAIRLMDQRGIDIRQHIAGMLDAERVREAQLLLAMTRSQCKQVVDNFPVARGKIYRLGEHDNVDVVDPYQRSEFTFNLALTQIEQGISRWLGAIALLDH